MEMSRKILVIYCDNGKIGRNNLVDSIFCFKELADDMVFFFNYFSRFKTYRYLYTVEFDVVIFHYSFMVLRGSHELWMKAQERLDSLKTKKRASIIQDEYIWSENTDQFLTDMKIDSVFTLAHGEDIIKLYPRANAKFYSVHAGYVNSNDVKLIQQIETEIADEKNTIDIGYRARGVNWSLGWQGWIKTAIVEKFTNALKNCKDIKYDILNTGDLKNVFTGLDWYRFLIRCRTMPGSMGGHRYLTGMGAYISV